MEEGCERSDEARRLRALVAALPARERALLTLRYGLDGRPPQTQLQAAAHFGISRSYVSRIEKRALETLHRAWDAGDGAQKKSGRAR